MSFYYMKMDIYLIFYLIENIMPYSNFKLITGQRCAIDELIMYVNKIRCIFSLFMCYTNH